MSDELNFVESAQPNKRKAVTPPAELYEGMNLFEYLAKCTPPLDKKIIDIAIAQTTVPLELRDDAAQEVRLMWSHVFPDCHKYKPGQIASYAHRIAKHAALRLRREIGSSVRLPGSAFRKRKDGSSYVTPGVLATALDWSELESWFNAGDGEGGEIPTALLNQLSLDDLVDSMDEPSTEAANYEEDTRRARHEILENHAHKLTMRQFQIMAHLIDGDSYDEIQTALSIKKGVLMREIAIASSLIGDLTAA